MVFVPLAAMIFKACGKHPIAGIAAGFAGVSGGYSANLLMGSIDASLAGLTQSAAQTMNADYIVNPTCNWFFMFTSCLLYTSYGTICRRTTADRLLLQSGTGNTGKHASGAAGNVAPSGRTGKETSGIERTTGRCYFLCIIEEGGTEPCMSLSLIHI